MRNYYTSDGRLQNQLGSMCEVKVYHMSLIRSILIFLSLEVWTCPSFGEQSTLSVKVVIRETIIVVIISVNTISPASIMCLSSLSSQSVPAARTGYHAAARTPESEASLESVTVATEMPSLYLRPEFVMSASCFCKTRGARGAVQGRYWFGPVVLCISSISRRLLRLPSLRSFCLPDTLFCLACRLSFAGFSCCTFSLFLLGFGKPFAHLLLRSTPCFLLHPQFPFSRLCQCLVVSLLLLGNNLSVHILQRILKSLELGLLLMQLVLFDALTGKSMKTFCFPCLLLLVRFLHLTVGGRSQGCLQAIPIPLLPYILIILVLEPLQVCRKCSNPSTECEDITVISRFQQLQRPKTFWSCMIFPLLFRPLFGCSLPLCFCGFRLALLRFLLGS